MSSCSWQVWWYPILLWRWGLTMSSEDSTIQDILNLPKEVMSSSLMDTLIIDDTSAKNSDAKSKEENVAPPSVAPTGTLKEKPVSANPLGDAKSKVQEEIGNLFAAMMASGTLRANEAVSLATKKVMQKYGRMNVAKADTVTKQASNSAPLVTKQSSNAAPSVTKLASKSASLVTKQSSNVVPTMTKLASKAAPSETKLSSHKSPTAVLFDVDTGRISIHHCEVLKSITQKVLARSQG
ncbi:desumoylating isopeptidase 1 [Tanacetum coccineum]